MVLYAGPIWRDGEPTPGWVRADDRRATDWGEGAPPGPSEPAVILHGLTDLHTHVGDAFLRGQSFPTDLAAVVAPGTGYKHRMLAQTEPAMIAAGVREHLRRLAAAGTADALDFREQGAEGLALVRDCADAAPKLGLRLFGRPLDPAGSDADLDRVLAAADGLGIPGWTDYGAEACHRLAGRVHARGLPVALHASEARREPMEAILALEPDLLVHLCTATDEDLRAVAEAGVPVACCPTSNRRFGLRPPVQRLESLGVPWGLGTDNAMFGGGDLLDEVRELHRTAPDLPDAAVLRALTTRPEKCIKRIRPLATETARSRPMTVLRRRAAGGPDWSAPALRLEAPS